MLRNRTFLSNMLLRWRVYIVNITKWQLTIRFYLPNLVMESRQKKDFLGTLLLALKTF